MTLKPLLLILMFLVYDAAAQSSHSDFLPLALGNEWVYEYYAVDDNIFDQSAVSDSGVAVYTIVSMDSSADSTIWGIRETRDIIRASYSYWYGLHYFSRLPVNDSVLFSLTEYAVGNHHLIRSGTAEDNWRSPFCMLAETTDSTEVFRFMPDEDSDSVRVITQWTWRFLPSVEPTYAVSYVMRRRIGITSVEYSTPGITGVAYRTHHKLHLQTIMSLTPGRLGMEPEELSLENNYPNPFNPRTILTFSLGSRERVRLTIVDILGRPIAIPFDNTVEPGRHSVVWDASQESSGTYFCVATTAHTRKCRRLILLK